MKFKTQMKDLIREKGMDNVIIIPKNSGLKDIVSTTLGSMGVDYWNFPKIDSTTFRSDDTEVRIYRGEDIPMIVEDLYQAQKIKAVGMTGDDLFDEYMIRNQSSLLSLLETVDWDDANALYRRPALCLLTKKGQSLEGNILVGINKKYAATGKVYLAEVAEALGITPTVKLYSGNTEDAVSQGMVDAGIEIVYSGKSLKEKDLDISDRIRCSDFAMIGVDEGSPKILEISYNQIGDRVRNPKEGSYTSKLASSWNSIVKKIGEENAEFIKSCIEYGFKGKLPDEKNSFEYLLQNTSSEDIRQVMMENSVINNEQPKKFDCRRELTGEFGDKLYTAFIALNMAEVSFQNIIAQEYQRFKADLRQENIYQ